MGYTFELDSGQCVYLENLGEQTHVTTTTTGPGQQQQSSSSIQTGIWTAIPEAFRAAIGVVVKLHTAHGERFLHIQGSRLSTLHETPSLTEAQPVTVQPMTQRPVTPMPSMPPMQSMSPLPPMTMGDMQMEPGTMSMQMGNMRLSMNPIARSDDNLQSTKPSPTSSPDTANVACGQRNFCSQCGVVVKPSDRFCASCGHRLD
ncbi:zinc ribbon domain-containing protein [Stenomitos frigidus]|uniref:Zinc ribbon domain-containing protein n=1 Tax=Stenomitos frigidus ULC18 TaxID=2107698 RepID=A0A2T1DTT8_9CYAN|nr:zinc ribbon domain-containing protein [Stenomitos frigidus]PSB23926.1 zinc ribbon domain-containing protein [Stenomitos frigidus ULC18]